MRIRITTNDNYETFNVTENMGALIVSQFLGGHPFTVMTDSVPGPWGHEYRVIHYNPALVVSVEPLDMEPPT